VPFNINTLIFTITNVFINTVRDNSKGSLYSCCHELAV